MVRTLLYVQLCQFDSNVCQTPYAMLETAAMGNGYHPIHFDALLADTIFVAADIDTLSTTSGLGRFRHTTPCSTGNPHAAGSKPLAHD